MNSKICILFSLFALIISNVSSNEKPSFGNDDLPEVLENI